MYVYGCDCSIVIKTAHGLTIIPFASETIRENLTILVEEEPLEGDGNCKGVLKTGGASGCVVTPLTIDTVPLLLSLAFGKSDVPVFVSGTRNLYKSTLRMIYREDIHPFDLIQNRTGSANGEKFLFEGCKIYDFEIRIEREQWIKLRFDVESEIRPKKIISDDKKYNEYVDCFSSDHVIYSIDRQECNNIYGVTIHCIKQEGFLTEIWIKEVLEQGSDVRIEIEELLITARLLRDKYEANQFGSFNIIMRNLVLTRDETNVESSGAVMGVRHYFVMGSVTAEVFQLGDEPL